MKTLVRIGLVAVIATAVTWQCIGAWQDSQTTDEAVHLTAGRSYWQTGQFYLNPEHPALFKLWAAALLAVVPNTKLQTETDAWTQKNEWLIGAEYLYTGPAQDLYGGRFLLFLGRLQMIFVWLGLVITLCIFSWRRWGMWISLVVTTFIAYDPNFLGHGHLVTNDVATAFGYLGIFLVLRKFINRPNWKNVAILSVVFAVAQMTKFSSVILWALVPIVMLIARWYDKNQISWRWFWRVMVSLVVVTSIVTWGSYGFRIDKINSDPRIGKLWAERTDIVSRNAFSTVPPYTQLFVRLSDPKTPTGEFLNALQYASVPGYWYWRGFFSAASHNVYGHFSYLLGGASETGWRYYFPVALAVKTPMLLLFSVLAFIAWCISHFVANVKRVPWRELIPFDFWILGFPPVIFLLWSMTSHINIGVRHVFPTYVFFPLAAGSVLAAILHQRQRFAPVITIGLSVIAIAVATSAWPNTIGYYNGLFGGTKNGHTYVLDSNLDWNQDIWRLKNFLDKNKWPEVHMALFGSIPSNVVFPNQIPMLQDQDINAGIKPTGIVAISAGQLYNLDGPFKWLLPLKPKWTIGSTISIYDFR